MRGKRNYTRLDVIAFVHKAMDDGLLFHGNPLQQLTAKQLVDKYLPKRKGDTSIRPPKDSITRR